MKVAILNDTHCGIRNSNPTFIDYQRKFYEEVFFPELEKHGIKKIIHLGDYFDHRRYVNFVALKGNREHFLDQLTKFGIDMDIIPGNHDVAFKNTNDVSSLDELLESHPRVTVIKTPTVIHNTIMMVPWLNNENYKDFLRVVDNTEVPFCFGHFEFKGFEMHKGYPSDTGMTTERFDDFDKVLSGHFHTKSDRGNIYYLGSQMEFTWHDVDDPKYFHIFDTETGKLEAVRNPHTLFIRVPYNDTKFDYANYDVTTLDEKYVHLIVAHKQDFKAFNKFVDRIENRPIHDLTISDSTDAFVGDNVESGEVEFVETSEIISNYIDAVDTPLDKQALKNKMTELYVLAQTGGDPE